MAWDPNNVRWWKHKVGFHNGGVQWDTPMARWAGEGNDWFKLTAAQKKRKEDVIRSNKQVEDKKNRTQQDQTDKETKISASL